MQQARSLKIDAHDTNSLQSALKNNPFMERLREGHPGEQK